MARKATGCQRSVLSCARCRKKKIKCDRQLPACTNCIASESTCTGFNSVGNTEAPRSVVQFLEHEIARLEIELGLKENPDTPKPSTFQHIQPQESRRSDEDQEDVFVEDVSFQNKRPSDVSMQEVMESKEIMSMISSTLPLGPSVTDVVSRVRMGLTPSVAVATSQSTLGRNPAKKIVSCGRIDASIIAGIPSHVINTLVKRFIKRILPIHPCLHEPTIWGQVDKVLLLLKDLRPVGDGFIPAIMPDSDVLTVSLILAVSATLGSSRSGHEARCMAFAESLFNEGVQHLPKARLNSSDLTEVQITLLILLYATINPKSANVSILSGAVMRSCLELGLHRETPDNLILDPQTIEMRRRVFWTAYFMDRFICSALQRPLAIPDPAIDVHLPGSIQDLTQLSIAAHDISPGLPALRWIEFAQLQSSMIEVHFQNAPLALGQTWDDWLHEMEEKLQTWHQSNLSHDEWTEFTLMHGLAILHRPSPRMPIPPQRSLLVAFEAASASARCCRDQLLHGFFRRPWLAAHRTFETAMITLFTLRHGYTSIVEKFSAEQIFEMTKVFTANFLTISRQGWAEISKYAGVYERLLSPLLEAIFARALSPVEYFDTTKDAELTRLLYPGPAHLDKLRFTGARAFVNPIDDVQFDVSLFNWEDMSPSSSNNMMDLFLAGGEMLTMQQILENEDLGVSLESMDSEQTAT